MEKLIESSAVSRKNLIVIGIISSFLFAMAAFAVYRWIVWHVVQPFDLFVALLLLAFVLERATAKFTYEVDKKVLRITKTGFVGSPKTYEIPYRDIIGIYGYKPKLLSVLQFRRTYRLQSALDGQPVWTIAYTAAGRKGKAENCRIYFKPSDNMLDALHEKMPSKVKIAEEEIAVRQMTKE